MRTPTHRRLIAGCGLLIELCLAATQATRPVRAADTPAVTYSTHIAPLLYKNCTACHHTGGSAPFSLMTYADAKRWSISIQKVTASRYMPPWLPMPGHGDFAGNRRLPGSDVDLLKHWVDLGTPEGDPADLPAAPVYASDWQLGQPDLVLEVESSLQVPADGPDLFRNFILPVPLQQSRWVRAMEIKPGSPQVVHHANLIIDRTASLRRTHPADWHNGIPGMDVMVDAGDSFDPDGFFLDWKPDSTALVEPSGMAWRIDPGNDLVLNMHLKPTGKVEGIRARIGLYFTPDAPTKLPILVQLEHDAALNIPPGDRDFVIEDHLRLPEAVDVLAIYPHAHYLGKRLEGWADLPDRTRRDLILIPDWDIDRQAIYRLRMPLRLPAGSVLHMRYQYDNSQGNPHNPNSPPIRVTNGNRSVDEMGHLWLQLLPVPNPGWSGDPRAPLLRAWMQAVLEKNSRDPIALFNLASLETVEGNFQAAADLYNRALQARPNDARTLTALASALDRTGAWQVAQEKLATAIALDPAYLDAHFDLATIDLEHDLFAQAEREFHAALTLNPQDVESHLGLASALIAEGRTAEAEPQLRKAAELGKGQIDILYHLASIEASGGFLPEAILHLKACTALQPKRVEAHQGLVAIYAQQNMLADAIEEQRTIVSLNQLAPDEWNNLGALLARNADRPAAYQAFQRALAIDPANETARSNLQRMQSTSN